MQVVYTERSCPHLTNSLLKVGQERYKKSVHVVIISLVKERMHAVKVIYSAVLPCNNDVQVSALTRVFMKGGLHALLPLLEDSVRLKGLVIIN